MTRLRTTLLVGALSVALPLGAVVGCGVQKKKTIKAELQSAADNLQSSKALSTTLRLSDVKGNLEKLMTKDDETPPALAKALLGGSVTFTTDPAGSKRLQDLQSTTGTSTADITAQLKQVNFALVLRDDKGVVAELRLVDGSLYAHVDIAEINRLAKLGGEKSIDDDLDEAFGEDPVLARALSDVRAGKWLKVPITDYIDRFKDLAKSFEQDVEPSPKATAQPDYDALGDRVFRAVKPYVKVTDAGDDKAQRVLDITVQVRPALKAALAVLQATKDLPFATSLKAFDPAKIDKNVADGTAHGTITLSNSHFTQFALDLDSVRTLDPEAGSDTLKGAAVQLDMDDDADQVEAPTDVSSFDIGDLLDEFLSGLDGEQAA